MAFKMKNPSMAKLTKAAGSNRMAMKMKMEDKAAAKMKKESAMKMKSPMKADIPEVTITDKKKPEAYGAFSHYTYGGKKVDVVDRDGVKFVKAGNEMAPLSRELKKGNLKYRDADGNDISYRYKNKEREGGAATKMQKASPAKQKMNMVKGPDGKMVPDFAVDGKGANDMKSGVKMVKAVRKKQTETKIKNTFQTKLKNNKAKPVKPVMSEAAKKLKAEYEADLAKKKAKADAKAEAKRIQEENLKISRERAKALNMTMKEYEKHLRSKMLKSQRKRIFGF